MESDSLLASLSVDGEIQAVIWWPVGAYLGLHQAPKLAHLPPNTTQNTQWAASSHCSTSEADPFVYV